MEGARARDRSRPRQHLCSVRARGLVRNDRSWTAWWPEEVPRPLRPSTRCEWLEGHAAVSSEPRGVEGHRGARWGRGWRARGACGGRSCPWEAATLVPDPSHLLPSSPALLLDSPPPCVARLALETCSWFSPVPSSPGRPPPPGRMAQSPRAALQGRGPGAEAPGAGAPLRGALASRSPKGNARQGLSWEVWVLVQGGGLILPLAFWVVPRFLGGRTGGEGTARFLHGQSAVVLARRGGAVRIPGGAHPFAHLTVPQQSSAAGNPQPINHTLDSALS